MKNVGIVADHQVEATIGIWINGAEGFRRPCRICMIQGFEDELAAAAFVETWAERAFAIEDRGEDAVVVPAEPASAGETVPARDHFRSVRPMARRCIPGAIQHLVSVRTDNDGPRMTGTAKDDD